MNTNLPDWLTRLLNSSSQMSSLQNDVFGRGSVMDFPRPSWNPITQRNKPTQILPSQPMAIPPNYSGARPTLSSLFSVPQHEWERRINGMPYGIPKIGRY